MNCCSILTPTPQLNDVMVCSMVNLLCVRIPIQSMSLKAAATFIASSPAQAIHPMTSFCQGSLGMRDRELASVSCPDPPPRGHPSIPRVIDRWLFVVFLYLEKKKKRSLYISWTVKQFFPGLALIYSICEEKKIGGKNA